MRTVVIPVDGVGPKLTDAACEVLEAVNQRHGGKGVISLERESLKHVSTEWALKVGISEAMGEIDAEVERAGAESVLFGAVGRPDVKDPGKKELGEALLLRKLRGDSRNLRGQGVEGFGNNVNIRPAAVVHPCQITRRKSFDPLRIHPSVFVTGDAGELVRERRFNWGEFPAVAVTETHLRASYERAVNRACVAALRDGQRHGYVPEICILHKGNVHAESVGLFVYKLAPELDRKFAGKVRVSEMHTDIALARLIEKPHEFPQFIVADPCDAQAVGKTVLDLSSLQNASGLPEVKVGWFLDVVRENLEDSYILEGEPIEGGGVQYGRHTEFLTKEIVRAGIDHAVSKGLDSFYLIVDSKTYPVTSEMRIRVAQQEAQNRHMKCKVIELGDFVHRLLFDPNNLKGVAIASNKFGDYASDATAGHAKIGEAASFSTTSEDYEPGKGKPTVGENVAGSGLKSDGTILQNPNPNCTITSAAMMLEGHGFPEEAVLIRQAQLAVLNRGIRTSDLEGAATTEEVSAAIAEEILERSSIS